MVEYRACLQSVLDDYRQLTDAERQRIAGGELDG